MNLELSKPSLFISIIQQEDKWLAIGSDKVNFFEVESQIGGGYPEITYMGDPCKTYYPDIRSFKITGGTSTMVTTTGSSPLAAVGALIDYLKDQEKEEAIQQAKRKVDFERFGGPVDEELISKVLHWKKKQEKKRQQEELHYDEWDEY